jgi:hypothetical protein
MVCSARWFPFRHPGVSVSNKSTRSFTPRRKDSAQRRKDQVLNTSLRLLCSQSLRRCVKLSPADIPQPHHQKQPVKQRQRD